MIRRYGMRFAILLALVVALAAMLAGWWLTENRAQTALAKNVYWEALAAGEPELSSRMVAHVTHVRAKANKTYWGGKDIHDVVYKPLPNGGYQFDWVREEWKVSQPIGTTPRWELAKRIAQDELRGDFKIPARLSHLERADHYLNPKHSGRRNICWFKTSLLLLGKAEAESQHVFYRTPTASEKLGLPKRAEVEECKPKKKKRPKKPQATAAR